VSPTTVVEELTSMTTLEGAAVVIKTGSFICSFQLEVHAQSNSTPRQTER
jgi:hypothetical protein